MLVTNPSPTSPHDLQSLPKAAVLRVLNARYGFDDQIHHLESDDPNAHQTTLQDTMVRAALTVDGNWQSNQSSPPQLGVPGRELLRLRYLHPLKKLSLRAEDQLSLTQGALGIGNSSLSWLLSAREVLGENACLVWSPKDLFTFAAVQLTGRAINDKGLELASAEELTEIDVVLPRDYRRFSIDKNYADQIKALRHSPVQDIHAGLCAFLRKQPRAKETTWEIPLTKGAELCFQLQYWGDYPPPRLEPNPIILNTHGDIKSVPRGIDLTQEARETIQKIAEGLRTRKHAASRSIAG